jgi:hypothetical protein
MRTADTTTETRETTMTDKRLQQCGCTVTPLPPKSIHQTTIDIRIDFCPLHAAAPELLQALKPLAHPRFESGERGDILYHVTKAEIAAAREAIRKAGGE